MYGGLKGGAVFWNKLIRGRVLSIIASFVSLRDRHGSLRSAITCSRCLWPSIAGRRVPLLWLCPLLANI
jgi:hypothetical protein